MAVNWTTPAGDLGILTERQSVNIPLSVSSDIGDITLSVIAGALPRGLRLSENNIIGSPTEVTRFTENRFVVRADDGSDKKDQTFKLSVDGSDIPEWVTEEGFLNVGPADAYFVLDNANVEYQLEVYDPDAVAGDVIEYYLVPNSGILPPGLKLSKGGVISGFTDPAYALNYSTDATGAYDSQSFDTMSFDLANNNSNGFDTFFFDNTTYDYNEPSEAPKRLSRIYTFTVAASDGVNYVGRTFKIYVVTEEFLKADNNIVQVSTNLFQADSSSDRRPFWITDSDLGKKRANNYITIPLDVYDPPSLSGTFVYFLLPENPDGSDSVIPNGMTLDSTTGDIAGLVPYQAAVTENYQFTMQAVNFPVTLADNDYVYKGLWAAKTDYFVDEAVVYNNVIYICILAHSNRLPTDTTYWEPGVSTAERTFTLDIIGELESAISWISESELGTIKPNQPSRLYVEAEALIYGGRTTYQITGGELPPGLSFLPTGEVQGKVKQFADDDGPGLLRYYDLESEQKTFNTTFDGDSTSFDRRYEFTVLARDYANAAELEKTFYIDIEATTTKTFANLYAKALQPKNKRLDWFNFITDSSIFKPTELYRYGDVNYGIQSSLEVLMFAGIESIEAVKYIQAMSRNHYRKRLQFGEVKISKGKNPDTQETEYEVVYVNIVDPLEKNGKSISSTVQLKDDINSKVLVSYDSIKVDSNIPFVSDSDHQRVFPNSIKNMRRRIRENTGERDREFLPLWMRSIQDDDFVEPGYTSSLVLCYAKPGAGAGILSRINASSFDFKTIDFEIDIYIIDIIDGQIEDKYLAFPQRGEKLP